MRTDKELLILLRDYIVEHGVVSGMCAVILWDLEIDNNEVDSLLKYIYDNVPEECRLALYWYPRGLAEPRINWLNEQINKL